MHKRVTVRSSDAYPADEKPLKLPTAGHDRYMMRVTVGYKDMNAADVEDYAADYDDQHGDPPMGVERFVIDFWPA